MVKLIQDLDKDELCACGRGAERRIGYSAIDRTACFEPYFEPALGQIIRSKQQKSQLLRSMKLEEVGTEPAENFEKIFEKEREKRAARAWEDL